MPPSSYINNGFDLEALRGHSHLEAAAVAAHHYPPHYHGPHSYEIESNNNEMMFLDAANPGEAPFHHSAMNTASGGITASTLDFHLPHEVIGGGHFEDHVQPQFST